MDNNLSKLIGNSINTLLVDGGKKQKELAEYLGVTDNTVSYFVGGKRIPNTEQIKKIAEFFHISADYLLGLSGEKTTNKDISFICDYIGLDEDAVKGLHLYANEELFDEELEKEKKKLLNFFISNEYLFAIGDEATFYVNHLLLHKKIYEDYYSALRYEKRRDYKILERYFDEQDFMDLCKFRLQEINKDFVKKYTKELEEEIGDLVEKIRQEELIFIEQRIGDTDGNHTQT